MVFGVAALLIVTTVCVLLGNSPSARMVYVLPVWVATRTGNRTSGAILVFLTSTILWGQDVLRHVPATSLTAMVRFLEQALSLTTVMLVFDYLERSIARSHRMAMHDAVTGLLNRRAAEEMGCFMVQRAKNRGASLVAIVVDCDSFKQINDQLGHTVGDRALRMVARALASNVRGSDIVCRVGGDEFLVLIMGADAAWSNRYLERVRGHLRAASDGLPFTPSISAGVAVLGRDGTSYDDLFMRADTRMFRNKKLAHSYDRAATNVRSATIHA